MPGPKGCIGHTNERFDTCESSPPGFVALCGKHCDACGGLMPYRDGKEQTISRDRKRVVSRKQDAARGSGYEKRVRGWMERNGYLVQRQSRQVIWIRKPGRPAFPINKKIDLLGAFDIMGAKLEEKDRFIQVGTVANRYTKRGTIQKVMGPLISPDPEKNHRIAELWSWGKWADLGYGFNVEQYLGGNLWAQTMFVSSKEAPQ